MRVSKGRGLKADRRPTLSPPRRTRGPRKDNSWSYRERGISLSNGIALQRSWTIVGCSHTG